MKNLIGERIPDVDEKRLILARYYIKQRDKGNQMKENEVYYMYNNLFRGDFQRANKYKLKWVNGTLEAATNNISQKLVDNYNQKWKGIYSWIYKYVNIKKHTLADCDKDIEGLRRKQRKELIKIFKQLEYYVGETKAKTSDRAIAGYHISKRSDQYYGSYSKLLEYAQEIKEKGV